MAIPQEQVKQIIKDTFENSFVQEKFRFFIKNLLSSYEEAYLNYHGKYIPEAYKQYIKKLERIGKYNDGENILEILVITLKKETSLERARTMQRNFIAWYLNGSRGGELRDGAIVAYVSPDSNDWRFSLVKMDYKFEKTKTGKTKVREEFTPARRWSFLVGTSERSHTAQSRFVNILKDDANNPTLDQLETCFDIETVSKEFFLKYRELFIKTKKELDILLQNNSIVKSDFKTKNVDIVNFAKKLLGQIVFLYFLQKKGWFGVQKNAEWGSGSKNFLRELFEQKHCRYENFYNDILEPLFYEALRLDRGYDDNYYSKFNCKIPFLNGGLFDPINNYDWINTDILLPNELFSNNIKTAEGDTGNGIFDVFDRYNFTVREDEPLEKEVAIDPELLGKAYEKFNAIRSDNFDEYLKALKSGNKGEESKFNKQYGVYYTPREIVHYMCRQSLINYLFAEINSSPTFYQNISEKNLNIFGNEGKKGQLEIQIPHTTAPEITKEDLEIFICYGENIYERDVLAYEKEKLIEAGKQKTTTLNYIMPESLRKNAEKIDKLLADIKVCDPAIGSGAFPVGIMSEIVKARNALTPFIKNQNKTTYTFKRNCIENSIYGVDIDSGAVEIAKLRLWLSLVVDEDDIKRIKPLPNLDYKILCGNSLLEVKQDVLNAHLFKELEELKPLHIIETNPTKKSEYKNRIDELISEITHGNKNFDFKIYFSEVFHHKGGFDIVIGNPPYVVTKGGRYTYVEFSEYMIKYFRNKYLTAEHQINTYTLFIELSKSLLGSRGVTYFIVPNTFLANKYSLKLREFLINKCNIYELFNTGLIFNDANVETVVIGFGNFQSKTIKVRHNLNEYSILNIFDIISLTSDKKFLIRITNNILAVIKKLNQYPKLREVAKVWRGLTTGNDKIFISNSKESKNQFPLITGSDIKKYGLLTSKKYVMYIPEKLDRPRDKRIFLLSEKLVSKFVGTTLTFAYDVNKYYVLNSACVTEVIDSEINIKYLLSLLNSKLLNFYFLNVFSDYRDTFPIMKSGNIESLPIPKVDKIAQQPFIKLVDKILTLTKTDDYLQNTSKQQQVKEYEQEIDNIVYKLYDLTQDEIKIIEGSS